jgi:hypothetical protein
MFCISCAVAGRLLGALNTSSGSEEEQLSCALLEAMKHVLEESYPVSNVLSNLSNLQKQLVAAAERLRDGPYRITFEVCALY